MKQGFISTAHRILVKLYDIAGLPFGLSSCLFNLKRRLDPYIEHQTEQEFALIEANNSGKNPDGSYTLNEEQKVIVTETINKMLETEVDYDYKPVLIEISDDLYQKMGMTGKMIESLEGIATIVVDGKSASDFSDFSEKG